MNTKRASETVIKKDGEATSRTPDDRVGAVLKSTRERLGLSVREVHEKTGISPAVLYGYEAGKTKPGAREIKLLCEALKITPNTLLFGTEDPFGLPAAGAAGRLARMADAPAFAVVIWTLLAPLAMSILDHEQRLALFSVLLSMVEAREPEAGRKIARAAELLDEAMLEQGYDWSNFGKLTAEESAAFLARVQERMKDVFAT